MNMNRDAKLEDLIGKTLVECKQVGGDEVHFVCESGEHFRLYHEQDCCEGVSIESITGDLGDLVGNPILIAEESTNSDAHPEGFVPQYPPESFTWTFYKFATVKGHVDIRFYGESNGYYSESVSFEKADQQEAG
jgi:hypothetical protein